MKYNKQKTNFKLKLGRDEREARNKYLNAIAKKN